LVAHMVDEKFTEKQMHETFLQLSGDDLFWFKKFGYVNPNSHKHAPESLKMIEGAVKSYGETVQSHLFFYSDDKALGKGTGSAFLDEMARVHSIDSTQLHNFVLTDSGEFRRFTEHSDRNNNPDGISNYTGESAFFETVGPKRICLSPRTGKITSANFDLEADENVLEAVKKIGDPTEYIEFEKERTNLSDIFGDKKNNSDIRGEKEKE